PFAKDFTEINLHSYKTEAENHISLFLDEFVLSNRRLQSTPAAPISAGEDVTNENVRLYCKTADNAQVSSIHNATCWILKKNGDTLLPLYVSEEVDTSLLYQRNIPFELDSGWYEWYCYFINNDGLPGKASARRKFNIATSQTTGALRVMDIYPSIPNESEEAAHLEPGEWYDWHIKSEKPFLHKDISYWLINISNPLYKFGHPGNKGGAFVCSLNVVYNISMTENGKWLFYEKKDNGSLKSIRVFPGTRGFLLDDTPETFKISHEEGYLRFRGMIPIEAIEGDWVVSVHAVDVEGKNTNILRKPVKVSRKPLSEKRRGPLLIVVIIFVSLSVLAVLFRLMKLKRKEKNGSTQDPSFEQVREYVVANIDKDLSLKSIAMNRSMSVKAVQDSLKRNGFKTLPAFMNKVRVEKAAVLLESPNLTVSEIGYSVGYDNSEYFSRIFREIIGITPSEYRKKFIS
ncbi:MAG: helix-turn-helix transcriptional regulator, partial [Fibrobacteres bacterium]|nr:helix-turn-helix transcriptional regulator [Fibrobacterota bacterium]